MDFSNCSFETISREPAWKLEDHAELQRDQHLGGDCLDLVLAVWMAVNEGERPDDDDVFTKY